MKNKTIQKPSKRLIFLSLLALFLLGGQALAQVTIKKEVPPPLELNIEDCVSAAITAPEVMTVYVVGTATEAEEGLIAKVTTEKFKIKPGVNRYSAAHLPPIAETWVASKYERLITRTGKFPEGNYAILIQLFTEAGELLDDDERKQEVKYPQIRLTYPGNGATITPDRFQWMTTRPIPGVEYKLSIYEVLEDQTSEEASKAGIPYFEGKSKTTSLPYPVGARAFGSSKSYAWQVISWLGDCKIGESEVWVFEVEGPKCHCPRHPSRGKVYANLFDVGGDTITPVQLLRSPNTIRLPRGPITVRITGAGLLCGKCVDVACEPGNINYNPNPATINPGNRTSTLNVEVTWDCTSPGCQAASCEYTYRLNYRKAGRQCYCGSINAKVTISKVGDPSNQGSILFRDSPEAGAQVVRQGWNLTWNDGDILRITISDISVKCWCEQGNCQTAPTEDEDINNGRPVTIDLGENDPAVSNDNYNLGRVAVPGTSSGWRANGNYVFHVNIRNRHAIEKNVYQDFTIRFRCTHNDCRQKDCRKEFRILLGSFR